MNTIITQLVQLTAGLLYIGESEFPFEVFDWGIVKNDEVVKSQIIKNYGSNGAITTIKTTDFFERYINRLQQSGDEVMMKDVPKYQAIQQYINHNFLSSIVYRCGAAKVGIYIICKTKQGQVFAIKTYSVET